MKKKKFLKKLDKTYYPQSFDNDWDGSCPCCCFKGKIDGKRFGFWTNCWRASDDYYYQELYIYGDLKFCELEELAIALKKKLDNQKWYKEYKFYIIENTEELNEISNRY